MSQLTKQEQLNYIQIQQEELTVLESIYLHDMKIIKSSPPFKFEIICRPFLSSSDEVSDAQYNLRIIVEFTKQYPDIPPLIEYQPITNISQDNVAQIEKITQPILDKINGAPILYELVETARSWIHINLIDALPTYGEKKDENTYVRKNYDTYTPVTVESFLEWKKKFDKEQELKKLEAQKAIQHLLTEQEKKITGEQYFKNLIAENKFQEEGAEEEDDDDEDEEEYVIEKEADISEESDGIDWNVE